VKISRFVDDSMETTTNQSLVIHPLCSQPGADLDFLEPEAYTIFGALFNEKIQNFE